MKSIRLVFGWGFCLILACQGMFHDEQRPTNIKAVNDAASLPYRFEEKEHSNANMYPISIDDGKRAAAYIIENDWHHPDTISSILFKWMDLNQEQTIKQFNINTLSIHGHYAGDFDNDGIQELGITYIIHDTIWLEVLDVWQGPLAKMILAVGKDQNQSGSWDAWSHIFSSFDLNNDGFSELYINCCCGYDLFPRKIVCANWQKKKIEWEYKLPGFVSPDYAHIVYDPENKRNLMVFGASSPCNGAESSGMDDCHSYLICMTAGGELIWKRATGAEFIHTLPLLIDYNHDQTPDIFANVYPENDNGIRAGDFIVTDLNGETLDSVPMMKIMRSAKLLDPDLDGNDEICISFTDNTVDIYEQNLDFVKRMEYTSNFELEAVDSFLDRDGKQILANVSEMGLILFDKKFKPLAYLPATGTSTFGKIGLMNSRIYAADGQGGHFYSLVKAPWYSIFSRYPLIAFLAGFMPLAAFAIFGWVILFKFRQKNIMISNQRDSLNTAFRELRAAQERLIDGEKYEQAKNIAGSFAHEIRNALFPARASIKRISEENRKSGEASEAVNKYSRIANDSVLKAIELTSQISDYTRLDSFYKPEDVNLVSVIEEVLEANQMRLEDRSANVEISGNEDLCIESNRRQFFSVINNLLLNSIDACRDKSECKVDVRWFKKDPGIALEFTDNGTGIQSEIKEKIFDAFCSYKDDRGIGLGLAIVKRVVEMYGGSINVESEYGAGTRFMLYLKEGSRSNGSNKNKAEVGSAKASVLPFRKK